MGNTKDIVIDLDLDFLLENPNYTEQIEKDFKEAMVIGVKNASEKIRKKLISNMAKYGVSRLVPFIRILYGVDSLFIDVFENTNKGGECTNVAAFIEYGTGIVGSTNPHPEFPWQYDVNDYGTDGWFYLDKDGKVHWTMGTKAKPFMYDTVKWIKSYGIIAREVNAVLKKKGYMRKK